MLPASWPPTSSRPQRAWGADFRGGGWRKARVTGRVRVQLPSLAGGGGGGAPRGERPDPAGRPGRVSGSRRRFPPRATGQACRGSRATGSALAFRREACGLGAEVTGSGALQRHRGDAPADALPRAYGAFHALPPLRRHAGRGVGGLCAALFVRWDFFLRREHPPPFSSRKPCGFSRSRKEAEKGTQTSRSCPSRPQTLKRRGAPVGRHLGAAHSRARPPTRARLSAPPRPAPRLAPPPGSGRVKPWNVAARNVHADEPRAGRGAGRAGAGRMLTNANEEARRRRRSAELPGSEPRRRRLGQPGRRDPRRPQGDGEAEEEKEEEAEAAAAAARRRRRDRPPAPAQTWWTDLRRGRELGFLRRPSRVPRRAPRPQPLAGARVGCSGRAGRPRSRLVPRPVPMEAPLAGEAADHA